MKHITMLLLTVLTLSSLLGCKKVTVVEDDGSKTVEVSTKETLVLDSSKSDLAAALRESTEQSREQQRQTEEAVAILQEWRREKVTTSPLAPAVQVVNDLATMKGRFEELTGVREREALREKQFSVQLELLDERSIRRLAEYKAEAEKERRLEEQARAKEAQAALEKERSRRPSSIRITTYDEDFTYIGRDGMRAAFNPNWRATSTSNYVGMETGTPVYTRNRNGYWKTY